MAKCCGGNQAALQAIQRAKEVMQMQVAGANGSGKAVETWVVPEGYVRMQFIGPQRGRVTYYANGRPYTGANNDHDRYVNARAEDVGRLEAMGVWRKVRVQAPPPPPKEPESAPAPVAPVNETVKPIEPVAPPVVPVERTEYIDRQIAALKEQKEEIAPKPKRQRKAKAVNG